MLTDFCKIELKLSGVLTLELQEDVQDVVAPDQVEPLLELDESSDELQALIIKQTTIVTKKKIIFFISFFNCEN
tara:strand:+ start:6270 stop:6491 length:222 start_codon:yes stop_codon:yes gene_type:complete